MYVSQFKQTNFITPPKDAERFQKESLEQGS